MSSETKNVFSVTAASKIMENIVHYYKGMGLSMEIMLAGYDKRVSDLYFYFFTT
jgi:20S proteasome subunit beta 5